MQVDRLRVLSVPVWIGQDPIHVWSSTVRDLVHSRSMEILVKLSIDRSQVAEKFLHLSRLPWAYSPGIEVFAVQVACRSISYSCDELRAWTNRSDRNRPVRDLFDPRNPFVYWNIYWSERHDRASMDRSQPRWFVDRAIEFCSRPTGVEPW